MAGLGALMAAQPFAASSLGAAELARKSPRLKAGDTVGLIEPASASDGALDIQLVEEVVVALGLKSKRGEHLLKRDGYLAGTDRERAADVNTMFADPDVRFILAVRGGC